jgi:hypothetical protein
MRFIQRYCLAFGFFALAGCVALTTPAAAGGTISVSAGTLTYSMSTGQIAHAGATLTFGNPSSAASTAPSSTGSSSIPAVPSAPSTAATGSIISLNLFGSSEGAGSAGSSSEGGGSSGGGLVWGDPLSADVGSFGNVHTRVHYFSQTGYNGTQQAVGINFSVRL